MPHPTSFTHVKDLEGGHQKLWRLDAPAPISIFRRKQDSIEIERDAAGDPITDTILVDHVLSSVRLPLCTAIQGYPETYIFPCDPDGNVLDWTELPGSAKGTTSHEEVMSSFLASFRR